MLASHTSIDIPALKARHPLGDTVEAAGVKLRGSGRVRQGLCPFHREDEGSFTVYSDSQRWYCFGCGSGGDVLDFLQRVENLTLPEALRRLDGGFGLTPKAAVRPAKPPRRNHAAPPPRNPTLLTAAARYYVPASCSTAPKPADTLLPGASDTPPPCAWAWASQAAGV